MTKFVEIRVLSLKPGMREEFHRRYLALALPLLEKWRFDVVAFGPSLHDEDSFYVIRAFDNVRQRAEMEDAYYDSADWRGGPREMMIELIDSYHDVVIEMDSSTVDALRKRVGL